MMRKMRLLFICSANLNRSPTFQKWFEKFHPEYDVKSTGCWQGYPDRLDETILDWADWVFVMDISHEMHLKRNYRKIMEKVRVVGVSDQYDVGSSELRNIIGYWYETSFKDITGDGMHLPSCSGTMCWCEAQLGGDEDVQDKCT